MRAHAERCREHGRDRCEEGTEWSVLHQTKQNEQTDPSASPWRETSARARVTSVAKRPSAGRWHAMTSSVQYAVESDGKKTDGMDASAVWPAALTAASKKCVKCASADDNARGSSRVAVCAAHETHERAERAARWRRLGATAATHALN
eukprot:5825709-Pleurochrysis_carterae.AAC.4